MKSKLILSVLFILFVLMFSGLLIPAMTPISIFAMILLAVFGVLFVIVEAWDHNQLINDLKK